MQAKKILNEMLMEESRRKYPELPYHAVKKYNTAKANGLTQAIIRFLQLSQHQAERISVQGRMVDERTTYTDVLGHTRQIGRVKYIKSSQQPGSADISAIIRTKAGEVIPWKIEVKVGRDRLRHAQEVYADQVQRAGGHYSVVRDFDDFYNQYQQLINK